MRITDNDPFPPEIWVNIFQKLTTQDKTVARRVCSIFNELILEHIPLFRITRILTLIKSDIKEEDDKLSIEILTRYFYLKKEEFHLECTRVFENDFEICSTEKQEIIKKLYNKHADAFTTYKYIFRSIFNGKENFLKLPVHHLSDSINLGDEYIDCIKTEELKYPIMRGKDNLKRIYFTIRGEFSYNLRRYKYRHPFCITFFPRMGMRTWVCGEHESFGVGFLDKPFVCREEGVIEPEYSRVVNLLQNKKAVKERAGYLTHTYKVDQH